mgnify:CR=1 FL=1
MKSERITFLATPEFKDTLRQELRQLTKELRHALRQARAALQDGLAQAEHSLRELRQADRAGSDERQVA